MKLPLTCRPLLPLVSAALIVLSGCSEPQVNTTSTVEVELVSDRAATVQGKYLLRFDTGLGRYVTLKKEAEKLLLTDWQVQAPDALRILGRNATVQIVEHKETRGDKKITSEVYELKTTLTVAAAPAAAALQSTYDVIARFPAALIVGQTLKTSAPSTVPEIRFHVLHYPRNSDRALGRIGKDFGLTVVFVIVAVVGAWLAEKQMSIGVIGLVGVGGALYYLFLTLRDLWWLITRLWGG